jgi:hypothetical protein
MEPRDQSGRTAFAGDRVVGSGSLVEVIRAAKTQADADVVIFDDRSGDIREYAEKIAATAFKE